MHLFGINKSRINHSNSNGYKPLLETGHQSLTLIQQGILGPKGLGTGAEQLIQFIQNKIQKIQQRCPEFHVEYRLESGKEHVKCMITFPEGSLTKSDLKGLVSGGLCNSTWKPRLVIGNGTPYITFSAISQG